MKSLDLSSSLNVILLVVGKDKYHSVLNSIEMKGRKRIKKRRRVNKPLVILSLAIVIVISLSAVSYLNQLPREKKLADEYFEIFDATVNDGEFRDGSSYEDSTMLVIYSISYKLRAKGGDAHDVIVKSWAKAGPLDLETILEDGYKYVEQTSVPPFGYQSEKAENGMFPFDVRISSVEAEGTITIYL